MPGGQVQDAVGNMGLGGRTRYAILRPDVYLQRAGLHTKLLGYDHNWSEHPNDIASTPPGEDPEVKHGQSVAPRDSGRRPVMYSWLFLVLPCLLLNYAGQVGYVLRCGVPPRANTFYSLTPRTGHPSVDHVILGADTYFSFHERGGRSWSA